MRLTLRIIGITGIAAALAFTLLPFVFYLVLNLYDRSISTPERIVTTGIKAKGALLPTILICAVIGIVALASSFRTQARK